MRTILFTFLIFVSGNCYNQNSVRLISAEGRVFKVFLGDREYNKHAQAEVLIENIKKDTVQLKIEFEGNIHYGITLYLLEKGKPCNHKEFNYRLEHANNKINLIYTGMYEASSIPSPLVPKPGKMENEPKRKSPVDTVIRKPSPTIKNCVTASDNTLVSGFCEKLGLLDNDGLRMQLLKKELPNYCLNISQTGLILKTFLHDRERLDSAKLLYWRCTEKEGYSTVKDVFTYEIFANEFEIFLKDKGK